jgi:hypothetical protein
MLDISTSFRCSWPNQWRILLVLGLYAVYLPLSGYRPDQFRFDAAEYWELSLKFTQHGHFSLLGYDEPVRGYLGPLLVLPGRMLCHYTGWSMLAGARVLGAGWAALLFGLAIPQLWEQVVGRPLSGGRWLVLLGLTFLFWRDYFNFTLSDMPALTLLLLGLVALVRAGWAWAALAGALLAAAITIRPIYIASAPAWVWLLFTGRALGWAQLGRAIALAAGLVLVLMPQWRINKTHFGQATPLVLGARPGSAPLYLKQLGWGTGFQRYETSLIPEIPRSLVYADSTGQRALLSEVGHRFISYEQYLRFAGSRPLATAGRYLRHLFNGLDVWYPTPYPTQLHPAGQDALRLLNYALLGAGTWLAAAGLWHARYLQSLRSARLMRLVGVLLALLLPCLLVLPTLVECRFLLPLHLLVLTGVAGAWQPVACWRQFRTPLLRFGAFVLLLGWLLGCWQLSNDTAGQLRPPSEAPFD